MSSTETVRKDAPSQTIAAQAYDAILDLIRRGEVGPDDLLSHRRMSERLGLGRLPVSVAMNRLEQDGLVRSRPRVGTRLVSTDAETVWGLLNWRLAMETQVARLASEWIVPSSADARRLLDTARHTDGKIEQVVEAAGGFPGHDRQPSEAMRQADEAADRADVVFHLLLAELSGAPQLHREMERLDIYNIKVDLCEAVKAAAIEPTTPPPDHVALAEAVLSGDADAAERTMRHHLLDSRTVAGFMRWYRTQRGRGGNGNGYEHEEQRSPARAAGG